MRILIVEDEPRIAQNLQKILQKKGNYAVDFVLNGEEGVARIQTEDYDLIVLDWMLPGCSGMEVLRDMRRQGINIPVLILTARGQMEDKIEGLDTGADDYLTKPFAAEELLARVRSLLRRLPDTPRSPVLSIGDLQINTSTHQVQRGRRNIRLSPREYALLEYLARHKNQAMDRMDIFSHVWDSLADPFSNTVDVHIRYLRKKVDAGFPTPLIRTVKGKGYMLCDR